MEAEPCLLWMVHRYVPQSTGDACTMAKAAGPSSPALQRGETLPVKATPRIGRARLQSEAPQTPLSEAAGSSGAGGKGAGPGSPGWSAVLTLASCDLGQVTSEPRFPILYHRNAK